MTIDDLDDWMLTEREAVASHIKTGFAQAERGELTDGDAAVERLRQRRARRELTPQAAEDLDAIWWSIAEESRDAANRVEMEIDQLPPLGQIPADRSRQRDNVPARALLAPTQSFYRLSPYCTESAT